MQLLKQLATWALRGELSKINTLYQRHAGETCYIFGDGISLKWMDLRQFGDHISIIGNFLVYHQEVDRLNAPYCTLPEPLWFYPYFRDVGTPRRRWQYLRHVLHKEYRRSIAAHPSTLFFLNFSNYPAARFPNAVYVSRWYQPPFLERNPFVDRDDAHRGSLPFQVSLAIFLGFQKAYLVGNDYTHFPSRSHHFYEKGQGVEDKTRKFCGEFLAYAQQHIDLVTVTLGAGSETMPSVTYKELTGQEPRFRENVELVNRTKLESLATYPYYTIF